MSTFEDDLVTKIRALLQAHGIDPDSVTIIDHQYGSEDSSIIQEVPIKFERVCSNCGGTGWVVLPRGKAPCSLCAPSEPEE